MVFIEGILCEEPIPEVRGIGVSTETVGSMHTGGDQNMPPQHVPLGYKDYFELEANENQQMQKDAFI